MIILRLITLFWKPIAWVLGIGATYLKGRADARRRAKAAAQADTIDALQTRERIEDEIDQDSNLIDRAARAGLVRRDGN